MSAEKIGKIGLQPGDELRLVYKENGKFSAYLERQPAKGIDITQLHDGESLSMEELLQYLTKIF